MKPVTELSALAIRIARDELAIDHLPNDLTAQERRDVLAFAVYEIKYRIRTPAKRKSRALLQDRGNSSA